MESKEQLIQDVERLKKEVNELAPIVHELLCKAMDAVMDKSMSSTQKKDLKKRANEQYKISKSKHKELMSKMKQLKALTN